MTKLNFSAVITLVSIMGLCCGCIGSEEKGKEINNVDEHNRPYHVEYSQISVQCHYEDNMGLDRGKIINFISNNSIISLINETENGFHIECLENNNIEINERITCYIFYEDSISGRGMVIEITYDSEKPMDTILTSEEEKKEWEDSFNAQYIIDKKIIDAYLSSIINIFQNQFNEEPISHSYSHR